MKRLSAFILNFLIRANRFISRVLIQIQNSLHSQAELEASQLRSVVQSTNYHMRLSPDENYYLYQYLHWINQYLPNTPQCAVLDLGCGQGRFLEALSKNHHDWLFKGVDISENALNEARKALNVNIKLHKSDIASFLSKETSGTYDILLLTEVTFFYPKWKELIPEIERVLKPGGLAFISFRPQYFYGLISISQRDFDNTSMLINHRSGYLSMHGAPDLELTWQRSDEIKELFLNSPYLNLIKLVGIGCCSGIPLDPHQLISQPSLLTPEQQSKLMELEIYLGDYLPDNGRYMLAVVQKR